MERDLVLGYMSIKLTSFLAMYLHGRDESAGLGLMALCLAGFAAGLILLARSWAKARALVDQPAATIEEPVAGPVRARAAKPPIVQQPDLAPAVVRESEPA
jgi:hypothetical protein